MQTALPASGMPRLMSKLAVVPANPAKEAQTLEEKFQEVFDQGTEVTERLEITKSRLEKELRRRSENFRDLVKSRNTDIQQEYARMLKELDDQVESLDQEIAQERDIKAERAKRRREEALERKASKKQHYDAETTQLKEQLEDFTSEIRQLQEVFARLEKEVESQESENSPDDVQSIEERRRLEEERAQNEIVELQQEIVLLKEAQEAIAEKIDKQSLKTQYEDEKQEVREETAHQLCGDSRSPSSPDSPPTPRKTVDLKAFLNSCPSFEEGNRAIDELKKLQLIHCYESSGIIALAD
ncbi:hypothetical protein AM588_10006415 [Phytophthora nicotianae]|uniref:Uncharacterized protein n=1 Tax=Phytophthora nicotianae TaxID=4792 RepID=A0A0W8DKW9_PHYNI|nr:hypothetical protein AM588_10006415 [Phytophthora nicotianae]